MPKAGCGPSGTGLGCCVDHAVGVNFTVNCVTFLFTYYVSFSNGKPDSEWISSVSWLPDSIDVSLNDL